MKFTLKNIAIIILVSLFQFIFIGIKVLHAGGLNIPSVIYKADFWKFESIIDGFVNNAMSKCITHPSFYTREEIIDIFQFQNYTACTLERNDKISYSDGVFDIKCSKNEKPEYGKDKRKFEYYGGSIKNFPKWTTKTPSIASKQFLFIRCSKSAPFAFVFNHFKQSAANAAKKIQKKFGDNEQQMSVLLLVFDSISKYSFERNLPLTHKFLEDLNTNKKFGKYFSVNEFDKSAIPQPSTRPNMAQILYGKKWEEISEVVGKNTKFLDKNKDKYINYQKNAIWSHFSSLGYVTMFSHATVNDYISSFTGRYIQADHVFTNFWRYLWGVTNLHPYKSAQKCIGGRNSHDFSFDYTYQFFNNYPKNNKFAYVHSDAAHENSGNVKTIDEDLLKFLKKYLSLIKARNENLAIFLMSDHGNKKIKNSSQWDTRSYFESHTPFTYLITTKNLIKSLKMYENLKHNEQQLLSRYDINLSLKHLAYFPYDKPSHDWYPKAKDYYTYNNTISLFEEKIDTERTCADMGVNKEHCICSWYEPVQINEVEDVIKQEMIELLRQYLNDIEGNLEKCLVLNQTDNINVSNFILMKNDNMLIKLYKLEIETKKKLEIVVEFNFCLKENLIAQEDSFQDYEKPFSILKLNDEEYFLQLSKVNLPENCSFDFCDC